METIKDRITAVYQQISQATKQASRRTDDITLVAVTKTWPVDTLLDAYDAGLRDFGENRTDELEEKRAAFETVRGRESGVTWHFIGHLQSRKATAVADSADVFHAVERVKIVNKLQDRLAQNGRLLPVFIEVNVSGESSKSGIDCSRWEQDATQQSALRKVTRAVLVAPNLSLLGLMTMAPWHAPDEEIRTVFARARALAEWLRDDLRLERPLQLSMGMTDDFEMAITEGATHIRVGRALFGERHNN